MMSLDAPVEKAFRKTIQKCVSKLEVPYNNSMRLVNSIKKFSNVLLERFVEVGIIWIVLDH